MEKIRFFDSENNAERTVVLAEMNRPSRHIVELKLKEKVVGDEVFANGFELIDENNMSLSCRYYSSFNTIYNKSDDELTITLSDDGSVAPPPPEEEVQAKQELNAAKEDKIIESKVLLAEYLETHPLVSSCHNNKKAKYTVTAEKQALMSSNYLSYTIAKSSGMKEAVLTWNAAGCECEVWTEEEYAMLILETSVYVKPLVSMQQYYEVQIKNCKTKEELDEIEIKYE